MEEIGNGYQQSVDAYQQHTNNAAIQNNAVADLFGFDSQYSSQESLLAARMQNEFNSAEAAKNRNWQEYMSNTANQRAVKDLEAAGFSPLALLGNTSSASTPGGSAASAGSSFGGTGSKSGELMKGIMSAIVALGVTSATMAARANVAKLNNDTRKMIAEMPKTTNTQVFNGKGVLTKNIFGVRK